MRGEVVLLMRAAIANVSPCQDQRWLLVLGLGLTNGGCHVFRIIAIRNHASMPATRFEAFCHVLGKVDLGGSSEGDMVLIVQINELPQTQMSGQGSGFLADTLHQDAIATDRVRRVID